MSGDVATAGFSDSQAQLATKSQQFSELQLSFSQVEEEKKLFESRLTVSESNGTQMAAKLREQVRHLSIQTNRLVAYVNV